MAGGYGSNVPEAHVKESIKRQDSGGLSGFGGVACMKRSARNLGDPIGSCFGKDLKQVGMANQKKVSR